MANVYSGFADQPEPPEQNFIRDLGMILSLLSGAAQGQPLAGIQTFNQMQLNDAKLKEYKQQQQAARQQAAFRNQASGLFSGGLQPGQQGPPAPMNDDQVRQLAQLSMQNPEIATVFKALLPQLQQSGIMPGPANFYSQQAQQAAAGLTAPGGLQPDIEQSESGFKVSQIQPKTPDALRTNLVRQIGGTAPQQLGNLQQSDVKLMNDHELVAAIQAGENSINDQERALAGTDRLGNPIQVAERDRRAIRVGQIAKAAQLQDLQKEGVRRRIYSAEQSIAPQFQVPYQTVEQLDDAFRKAQGRKPTEQEMFGLIADHLFPSQQKKKPEASGSWFDLLK